MGGKLDVSGLPLHARLALALDVLFKGGVIELPVKLPPMNRAARRLLGRARTRPL
jgi:hypothetical protein